MAVASSLLLLKKSMMFFLVSEVRIPAIFYSHLDAALCQKKINAFIDDEELKRGEQISPSLLNAIEQSKISLIISEGYASSRWCLKNLEDSECKNSYGQIVIPFSMVLSINVRNQMGLLGGFVSLQG
ncbi:disease resistance protein RLM3-like [Pistacia vera]|uniref:disease resistance protein RLM3-like n=1 Tax=Pistacia vera TaxID=55513 RepID=UPI0012639EFC|nr:disease resistance protein RLM3-like [Pistacia vera]